MNARIHASILTIALLGISHEMRAPALLSISSAEAPDNRPFPVTHLPDPGVWLQSDAAEDENAPPTLAGLCFTGPANDNYPAAINVFTGRRSFSTLSATRSSTGQAATSCWGSIGGSGGGVDKDVWFLLEADEAGTWTASLCDSTSADTRIAIYAVSSGAPAGLVACNDDACGDQASVSFTATLGQLFYIQVGSADSSGTDDGMLEIGSP